MYVCPLACCVFLSVCVARQTRRRGKSPGNLQGALPPCGAENSACSGYSQLGRAQGPETREGLALAQISRGSQHERKGRRDGGSSQEKKKNVTVSKREYNPLITLLGFSGEQRVNLRGSRSRDSEGADREGPGLPDARAEPDPRRRGAADDELGSLPERPPRLPGTVVDQTPDNQSRPAPPRGDGESE